MLENIFRKPLDKVASYEYNIASNRKEVKYWLLKVELNTSKNVVRP